LDIEITEIEILEKSKILVVDDDETLLKLMVLRLQKKFNILTALSGEEALNIIKEGFEPDVIIADQFLGDMKGSEFLRRSMNMLPNSIRMIISSHYESDDVIETIHHGNALIYLTKPVRDIELLQSIEYCLKQHRTNLEMDRLESIIKPKILIAEDSKVMLHLMLNLLSSLNAEIFQACDGADAIKIFEKEQNFDLVILDIIMPNLDGFTVCKKIREIYSIYELPILFLTSLSESKDIVKGFDVGGNDYLLKPFKSAELISRTKTLIKLRRLSQSTTALKEVIDTKNHTLKRLQEEISYREIIEKQLIEEKDKANIANRLKSEFLANMSHEIRTPLNAIIGFSELLKGKIIENKYKEYLDSIVSSGKSLLTLINDILDLSKIEANRIELEYGPCNVKNLFLEISGIFKLRAQAKGIEFRSIIDENIHDFLILDELRLRQVLINLVGNAIKFTEKGFVEINLHFNKLMNSNVMDLYIDVIDSGIGIAQDQSEVIFEAFQQHSSQSHKAFGGTGLGLTITRKFIQMMNGSITLSSEISKGSKFTVFLPGIEISTSNIEASSFNKNIKYEFFQPKILLVDDNENNRKLIFEFLLDNNVRIFEAENGEQAIDSFILNQPDLVLMDLKMPIMDGFEAIEKIKLLDSYNPKIPIIGLTALAFTSEKEKIFQAGFNGYISKPIHIDELFKELTKYLPHRIIDDEVNEIAAMDDYQNLDISVEVLNKVIPELTKLLIICEDISKTRRTKQIKDFASELLKIAIPDNIQIIIDYAEKINSYTINFDMESVKKMLSDYPKLIENLKKIINN
jgi:CheY-like chemotaxis protein